MEESWACRTSGRQFEGYIYETPFSEAEH